jgi:hypothetical protein
VAVVIVLIVVLLGVALLYFWLVGHWFARVLVTPVIWAIIALVLAAVGFQTWTGAPVALTWATLVLWALAIPCAWFIAGIPIARARKAGTGEPPI